MKIEIRKVDVCVRKKEDADLCKPLKELQEIVDEYVKDAASQFDEIASDKDAIYQVANIIDNAGLAIKKYGRDEHFITSSKPKITFKCAGGRYQICAQYGIFELNDETEAMECDAVLDRIELNGKWSFIDKDGNLPWKGEEWFDNVGSFHEGYATVELDNKYNWIDKDGNFLWKGEKWFDYAGIFDEGPAMVKLNGKYNFIDKDGDLLWKGEKWFDGANNFDEGYARVELDNKYNWIDKDGNLLWKGEEWFDNASFFFDKGYAEGSLNGKWYKIDKEGNLHDIT